MKPAPKPRPEIIVVTGPELTPDEARRMCAAALAWMRDKRTATNSPAVTDGRKAVP